MAKYFKDSYGCSAKIVTTKDGTARLTISTPGGHRFHNKTYKTYKGARTALGKMSDAWTER